MSAAPAFSKRGEKRKEEGGGLNTLEKLAAMVALGQLMRIAASVTGLSDRVGSAFKTTDHQSEPMFLCDADNAFPTALPGMLRFQQTLTDMCKI